MGGALQEMQRAVRELEERLWESGSRGRQLLLERDALQEQLTSAFPHVAISSQFKRPAARINNQTSSSQDSEHGYSGAGGVEHVDEELDELFAGHVPPLKLPGQLPEQANDYNSNTVRLNTLHV